MSDPPKSRVRILGPASPLSAVCRYRHRRLGPWFSTLLLAAGIGTTCQVSEPRISLPTPSESRELVEIGTRMTDLLTSRLRSALMEASSQRGIEGALEVCSRVALELTEEVAHSNPEIRLKRTSRRYRNPANAPDRFEDEMLGSLESRLAAGEELPSYALQKIEDSGRLTYRYYRPLRTADFCLNCHGDPAKMKKELVEILETRYPKDRAVGYQSGEFRGVIRVEVSRLSRME